MSRKFTAARRNAFLWSLAETGNVSLSAERAKVSRSWVQLHRSSDPEFDEACRAAVAAARELLAGAEQRRPADMQPYFEGQELVVRGSNGRRAQVARARLRQWSPRVEDRFLQGLAATCNVRAACRMAGMGVPSAYGHRKRWPSFARRWDEAVDTGYVRLEMALLQSGENLFSSEGQPAEAPIPPMTVEQAIHFLNMHKNRR